MKKELLEKIKRVGEIVAEEYFAEFSYSYTSDAYCVAVMLNALLDEEYCATRKISDEEEVIKVKSKEIIDKLNKSKMELFEVNRKGEELITETGVYSLILSSPMPEAKEFKKWVKGIIKYSYFR